MGNAKIIMNVKLAVICAQTMPNVKILKAVIDVSVTQVLRETVSSVALLTNVRLGLISVILRQSVYLIFQEGRKINLK